MHIGFCVLWNNLLPCNPGHLLLQVPTLFQRPKLKKDAGGPEPPHAQTTDFENKVELCATISPDRNTHVSLKQETH